MLKKGLLILADLLLAVYLVFSFSAFNKPEKKHNLCKTVNIVVADELTNGFIGANEVEKRLKSSRLYPVGKYLEDVNCRKIEEMLMRTPFVRTADCYKNQVGELTVKITQRLPLVRIKTANGDDYYIDEKDCIMPNTDFTSDIIIATGNISRSYAVTYISPLVRILHSDDLYRNMFEQINVTHDMGIELIPRVGDHVVYIGHLPKVAARSAVDATLSEYMNPKLSRLVTFYKYGLGVAGWNKYSEISLEFDNQIVCKKKEIKKQDTI